MDTNNKIIELIKENARLTSELAAANAEKDRLSQELHEHCIKANIEMFKLHIGYRSQRESCIHQQNMKQNEMEYEMLNKVLQCKFFG